MPDAGRREIGVAEAFVLRRDASDASACHGASDRTARPPCSAASRTAAARSATNPAAARCAGRHRSPRRSDRPSRRSNADRSRLPDTAARNSGSIGATAFTPNVIGTASRTSPRGAIDCDQRLVLRRLAIGQQPRRALGQFLSGIGQRQPPRGAVEQPRAQPLLQPADRLGHRGLGQRQFGRRPPQTTVIPRLLRKSRAPSKSGSFAIADRSYRLNFGNNEFQ